MDTTTQPKSEAKGEATVETTEPKVMPPFDPMDFAKNYAMDYAKVTFNRDGFVRPLVWVHTDDVEACMRATEGCTVQSLSSDEAITLDDIAKAKERNPQGIVLTIPVSMDNEAEKNRLAHAMAKLCEEIDADMYMFVSEVWTAAVTPEQAAAEGGLVPPSQRADRKEFLMVTMETPGHQNMYLAEIIRPEDGKPYLGEFTDNKSPFALPEKDADGNVIPSDGDDKINYQGRFTGILPSNRASNTIFGDAEGLRETLMRKAKELNDDPTLTPEDRAKKLAEFIREKRG
jgi:hypothetical protein